MTDDARGVLLPVYMVADESASMANFMGELNAGLTSLHRTLLKEPMTAAKVRFSVLGFSTDVVVRLPMADLREVGQLPELCVRSATNYEQVFLDLQNRIPGDVGDLKTQGYQVHRPAVFFLSDGLPNQGGNWRSAHQMLTDRSVLGAAPNIVACGFGEVDAQTILAVATSPNFAFIAVDGDVGSSIANLCGELTRSVVASGRSVGAGTTVLTMDKPQGFEMAVDLV
jgi:uncharacterized protein YegL